ncbi:MAG: helix-turn-helix transcriptional regulator [Planctomycetes bacterium]|nr:helix-turn-helix transcriptional regulator [Planctomycetota bacterium]
MSTTGSKVFGEFFKNKRISLGFTLRRFCEEHGLDAGNLSRMERGILPPPQKREKLEEYAGYLKIKEGSDEWYQFFDLARASAGKLPDEILNDAELVQKLPMVFRTMRGQKLSGEQLKELIEKIRKA